MAPGPLAPEPPPSMLERLSGLLDEGAAALNLRAQLDALSRRVEDAIEQLVNLIVVFTVQTLVVPVAALLAAYWGFLWLWRWSLTGRSSP
jgi:hypothetical protein